MSSKTDKGKRRTITLTGRAPVSIFEAEWPVTAKGNGDSYGSGDYSRYQQAQQQGEIDVYCLRVRRHTDGRTLVYGVLDAAPVWTGSEDHRGGVLLAGGEDVAAAIRSVGEECEIPDSVIRECIADLPAEEI